MAARMLSLAGLVIVLSLMGFLAWDLFRAHRRDRDDERALRARLDAHAEAIHRHEP